MIAQSLSHNLKQLRHKNGWNQEDVAKALDISIPAYSKIESGITDVNLSRIEQLAILYKMSVLELLTDVNTPEPGRIAILKDLLLERDQQVIDLQKQVIELYKNVAL